MRRYIGRQATGLYGLAVLLVVVSLSGRLDGAVGPCTSYSTDAVCPSVPQPIGCENGGNDQTFQCSSGKSYTWGAKSGDYSCVYFPTDIGTRCVAATDPNTGLAVSEDCGWKYVCAVDKQTGKCINSGNKTGTPVTGWLMSTVSCKK